MAKIGCGYQLGMSWVHAENGSLPKGAVEVQDGIYVARAEYEGDLIPGKYVPKYGLCYVPYGGNEIQLSTCEVLCDRSCTGEADCFQWESASDGSVPKKAIVAGTAVDGTPLYIAKSQISDEMCAGKVHEGHSCAYICWEGASGARIRSLGVEEELNRTNQC